MEENSLRTRLVCATIDEPLTKAQLQSMPREELEKMLRAKSVKYAEEGNLKRGGERERGTGRAKGKGKG